MPMNPTPIIRATMDTAATPVTSTPVLAMPSLSVAVTVLLSASTLYVVVLSFFLSVAFVPLSVDVAAPLLPLEELLAPLEPVVLPPLPVLPALPLLPLFSSLDGIV